VTFGETMAAMRAAGPLRLGGPLHLSVAGAESNVAIGLARLGHRVSWAGRVGADELGALVLRTLRAESVDVGHAVTDSSGRPTGLLIFEPRLGDLTRVSYYRVGSAGSAVAADDVLAALAPAPRVLHLTGITPALSPAAADAVRAAAQAASQSGVTVCLDVNFRSRLWTAGQARAALTPLLRFTDLLVASEDELPVVSPGPGASRAGASQTSPGEPGPGITSPGPVTGEPGPGDPGAGESTASAATPEETATALLAEGPSEVVIKRGAAGATAVSVAGAVHRPARRVPVAGLVGAGDAFVAGYLSGHLDGLEPAERLDRAVSVAAFAVASRGDWEGLPTRDELTLLDAAEGATIR
jgi:2-dehydro-3-deoxygluconokinase